MRITIIKITGISYRRSLSHAKRLEAQGTHDWDGKVLRERDPRSLKLRDRIFPMSPRTSVPPEFLPFNYPLPAWLLETYQL